MRGIFDKVTIFWNHWSNLLHRKLLLGRSRSSSVSKMSGYGLDDRPIEARSTAEAKDFSSGLCVHSSEAHPASCTMGTGGPFPGGKERPGRGADQSPHLVLKS
jgi:hypothetical protein